MINSITKVVEIEKHVRGMGGIMYTYCDVTATKDEFYEMFDHTL